MADNNGNIEIGNERERECVQCSRLQHQIAALKEVSTLRQGLLDLKEKEVKDLIDKLKFFEDAIDKEREIRECLARRVESAEQQCTVLTENLQRNAESIGEMQSSYDNQIATLVSDMEASDAQLRDCKQELSTCQEKNVELNKQVSDLDRLVVDNKRAVRRLENQLKVTVDRNKVLSYQMSLLNNLFNETDVVLIDFDKIKAIGDIVRETHNLPELELDETACDDERRTSLDLENVIDKIDSEGNSEEIPGEESCYKSVDTISGPQLVLSVSRTFIKLKDLILEKKYLQREIDTLKTLNSKLETKVDKQERRLYCVTVELNKTWSLVSKLKVQHNKLHTNEAVLKYELHEKRRQLEKLKVDLSVSREKWLKARQKNSESQIVWQNLRDEFSRRKQESSQESAFSENMSSSSTNEDEEGVTVSKSSDEPSNEQEDEPEGAYGITLIPDPDEEIVEEYMDPLEDMVSDLVEEIEATAAEGDAEDEGIDDTANSSEESSSEKVIRRANRLRMLEEQCHLLHSKLLASTARSTALASKLASLHSHYGSRDSDPENSENYHQEASSSSQVDEATPSTSTADADSTFNQTRSEVYDTEMPSSENDSQIEEIPVINHSSENNESESNSGTGTIHNAQIVLDVQSVPPVDFVDPLPNAEIVEPFVYPMNAGDSTENLSLVDSLQMPNLVITTHNPVVVENANLNVDADDVAVDPILEIIQQVDLLSVEYDGLGDSTEHLSDMDVSREQSPILHPLLPIDYIENESDEEDQDNNNENSSSSEGSFSGAGPDPNFLGRLIIKQLPMRLELLKNENQALMKEAAEVKLEMQETERLLKREVSKRKKSNEKLKLQIENKNLVEFELREDLGRKEQTIEELQKEIEEAKIVSEDYKRKVEAVNDLMRKILEEKADMERSKVTFKSTKFCYGCDKTFSLFKRKHHCTICGQVFCKTCASKSKTSATPESRSVTKCRICKNCEGRRDEINILATQFNDKTL